MNSNNADAIDFSCCMVLLGLVDRYVHLTMSGTDDQQVRQNQRNASFSDVSNRVSQHIKAMLDHGVVAVRDTGDSRGYALRIKEEHQASDSGAAQIIIKAAGKAWHAVGRYGRFIGRTPSAKKSLALSLEKAIQYATLNGATLLGIADHAGSITLNIPATFIVIKGGPENLPDALESPEEVFIRGRRVGLAYAMLSAS